MIVSVSCCHSSAINSHRIGSGIFASGCRFVGLLLCLWSTHMPYSGSQVVRCASFMVMTEGKEGEPNNGACRALLTLCQVKCQAKASHMFSSTLRLCQGCECLYTSTKG